MRRIVAMLSLVAFVGSSAPAQAATWAERRAEFKQRLGSAWGSVKDEVSQWPGMVRELPGAYADTLANGSQLRSVAAIPAILASGVKRIGHEAAYIPDYVREVPSEYLQSLEDGRQADSLAGFVNGVSDTATFGLLRADIGPRFGHQGAYQDGKAIGDAVVEAEVGTVVAAGVAAGATRAATAVRGAFASEAGVAARAGRGSSLLGVDAQATEMAAAERLAAQEAALAPLRAAEFAQQPLATGRLFKVKEMLMRYVGEWEGTAMSWRNGEIVKYFTDAERAAARLFVRDGKIYDAAGKLFDTSKAFGARAGKRELTGRAIFVMDEAGNLYASNAQIVGKLHHSSLAAGRAVAAAGELKVENGVLKLISNASGHYQPAQQFTEQALTRLKQLGVDVTDVWGEWM